MEAPATPLLLTPPPALDSIFGAFLLGTFCGLALYGVTFSQLYRYFRMSYNDCISVKAFVIGIFAVETIQVAACMHACYFYLVSHYFEPEFLLRGEWSIQPAIAALEVFLSQCFFARRVYLLRPHYSVVVALAILFSIVALGFGTAITIQSVFLLTFAKFEHYTWMDGAAFGGAVASDMLTTGVLLFALKSSRTGFKTTDHLIDRLTLYAVNTGLLTVIFDILALIFALVFPKNLLYSGISIAASKVYANSILAVLNTRHSGAEGREQDSGFGIHAVSTQNETRLTAPAGLWSVEQNCSDMAIEVKARNIGSV